MAGHVIEERGAGGDTDEAGEGGAPPALLSPADARPAATRAELEALRAHGVRWGALGVRPPGPDPGAAPPRAWRPGARAGRFEVVRRDGDVEEVRERPPARPSPAARVRRLVLGPALDASALVQERMSKRVALAVLSSDALSSVAYGPEAMLVVLVVAGSAGLGLALPVAGAIVVLVVAVSVSYRQTIRAYPRGGGSYIVASDNLGRHAGLVAAAGLMCDYVLTVAVSLSSGMAAVAAAVPALRPLATEASLAMIGLLLVGNLRGVRQAGRLFALPTYAFLLGMAALIAVGLGQEAGAGSTGPAPDVAAGTQAVTLLLVLRAFGSGATAMTGIEAIADGVPVFRRPEWRQARTTLTVMASLLVAIFAGIVLLAHLRHLTPQDGTTLLSQLAQGTFGSGPLYAYVQATTALILLMAANTAFNDFPRLLFFLARDGYAPRGFLHMGDRLAFSHGIAALAVTAGILVVAFRADTHALIPLYAVGVFLAFTLSQLGMVVHWRRHRAPRWRRGLAANAAGAVLSAAVLLVAAGTKFTEGAWVVLLLVCCLVAGALAVHRHHVRVAAAVAVDSGGPDGAADGPRAALCVVLVRWPDLPTLRALAYASGLGQPVLAVHLSPDPVERDRFLEAWKAWGEHVELEVVDSPYRAEVAPLAAYVRSLGGRGTVLTVVMPTVVLPRWQRLLHDRTAARLRRALRERPDVVITSVPFHVADHHPRRTSACDSQRP